MEGNRSLLVTILIVLVVVLAGGLMYFVGKNQQPASNIQQERPSSSAPTAETQNSDPTPSPTPKTTTTTRTTPSPSPAPVQTPSVTAPTTNSGVAQFAGAWRGTFSGSPIAGANCQVSGTTEMNISQTGNMVGAIIISSRNISGGTGTVDAGGNLKGRWSYDGLTLNFSGKLTGDKGSGSYSSNAGCFGSFQIAR